MTRSLYNTPGVHINNLLHEAHPAGSANIIDSPTHEGVVEDSIEAQMKTIKMVYKQPIAKVVASLAEQLESLGALDMAERVDDLGYNFFHESVLERNELAKYAVSGRSGAENVDLPAPGIFSKTPDVAKPVPTGVIPKKTPVPNMSTSVPKPTAAAATAAGGASRVSAIGNVLRYSRALSVTEALGAGSGAGTVGATGVGAVAIGVIVAGAAGYAVGATVIEPLLNWIGLTRLIGYLQSLFDDTPYSVAIQNIENSLSNTKINDQTSLEDADKTLRRARNQALVILNAPDVEDEEKAAVGTLLEQIQKLDTLLANATSKFLAEQQASPGKSNINLLIKQYNETKKRIDSIQNKAGRVSAISDDPKAAENEINKIFMPSIARVQKFKRVYNIVINDSANLDEKFKAAAVQANIEMNKTLDNMEAALDSLIK